MSTIVTRAGKGSPLTNNEVDSNFTNLNTDKIQVTGTPTNGQAVTWNGTAWVPSTITAGVSSVASADGSIVVTTVGGAVDLAVSEASPASTLLTAVRNTTGATLTKGTAVYISGATGQISTVSKALATSDATSAQTLGLITADISNNSNGYVTVIGLITNINTSAYTDGAQLYLSPTTAGTLTATKPYAPQHMVYVAIVEHAHPTQGKLFVKVQNGYEMDELHDVSAQSPTNGQTIVYNSVTGLWEKNTVSLTAGVNGVLPIANGGTNATDAATARTNLAVAGTAVSNTFSANQIVEVTDNTNAALRITQLGTGNALLVEDSTNPDASPAIVVNDTGNVILGYTIKQQLNHFTNANPLQVNSAGTLGAQFGAFSNDNFGSQLFFAKSRSASIGTNTIVQSGDLLGTFQYFGADGTNYIRAAQIDAAVDGTPGTNDMPGRLVFSTTADGASSPTERMRIDSAGNVGIGGTAPAGTNLLIAKNLTGSITTQAIRIAGQLIQSDVTSEARGVISLLGTAASTFTLGNIQHFHAGQGTFGAGSTVTNQFGFLAASSLTGATNNYGFYGAVASGTGRFNFYAAGTAANVFAGTTSLGGLVGSESLRVTPVASAVNYVDVSGSTTGNTVAISALGSDTNISLTLQTKGANQLVLQSSSTTAAFGVELAANTSADRAVYIDFHSSSGTDFDYRLLRSGGANNSITYVNTGTGTHAFQTNGATNQFSISNTTSAVNSFTVTGGTTGNAPTLYALGSDTNISINVTPKGTGALRLTGSTSGYVGLKAAAAAGSTTYTLPSADGTSGQVLSTNGSGTLSWATGGGGSASPGGSNTQVQYNSSGSFAGSANMTFDGTGITTGRIILTSSASPATGIYLPSSTQIAFTSYDQTNVMQLKHFQIGSTGVYRSQVTMAGGINTATAPVHYVQGQNSSNTSTYVTNNTDTSLYALNGNTPFTTAAFVNHTSGYNPSMSVCNVGSMVYTISQGNTFPVNATGVYRKFPAIGIYSQADGQVGNTNGTCFYGSVQPTYTTALAYYARVSEAITSGQGHGYQVDLGTHPFGSGAIGFYSRIISGLGGSYSNVIGWFHYDETTSGSTYAALFNRGGSTVGNITLSTSNTTYNTSSDPRLKNVTGVIAPDEAKSFVMALQPKKGTWKVDGSYFLGFLSTDYELVDPKAVNGVAGASEILGTVFDDKGDMLVEDVVQPPADKLPEGGRWEQTHVKEIYQTLEYGSAAWCANMTAHAQYLQSTIDALVARIDALEAK
jgi:hypothetical protein